MRSRRNGSQAAQATSRTNTGAHEPNPRLIMAVVAIGMIVGALLTPNTPNAKLPPAAVASAAPAPTR